MVEAILVVVELTELLVVVELLQVAVPQTLVHLVVLAEQVLQIQLQERP